MNVRNHPVGYDALRHHYGLQAPPYHRHTSVADAQLRHPGYATT